MRSMYKAAGISIGVALLWAGLATGVEGHSVAPDSLSSGSGKDEGQLWKDSPCAGCPQEELRAIPPAPLARLSSLPAHGGRVRRQVHMENVSPRYPRLWFKSGDSLLEMVTAKKSLFRESVVSSWRQESLPTSDGFLELWTW